MESNLNITAIGERLGEGDELAPLVYGFHPQYPASWSRELAAQTLNVAGQQKQPLLEVR